MTNKEMEYRKPEKKQAPLLPIRVIAAMEMLVMSEANATFVRFAAWCKLVKSGRPAGRMTCRGSP